MAPGALSVWSDWSHMNVPVAIACGAPASVNFVKMANKICVAG
jgi:hypothetical protein